MNKKTLEKFKDFLVARGAQILIPTNKYEILRFQTGNGVSIIYTGKRGETFTGESAFAYEAYAHAKTWTAKPRAARASMPHRSVRVRTLLSRDGNQCFYCRQVMIDEQISIEHLLSRAHGGNDHISNQALCHITCNASAGHLSIMDKIKIREKANVPQVPLVS